MPGSPNQPAASRIEVDALSVRLRSVRDGSLLRVWPRSAVGADWLELARAVASEVGAGGSVAVATEGDGVAAAARLRPLRTALEASRIGVEGLLVRPAGAAGEGEVRVTATLDGVVVSGPGEGTPERILGEGVLARLQLEAMRCLESLVTERHGIDLDAAGLVPEVLLRWRYGLLSGEEVAAPAVEGMSLDLSAGEVSQRLSRSLAEGLRPLVSSVASRSSGASRVLVSEAVECEFGLSSALRAAVPPGVEVTVERAADRGRSFALVSDERWTPSMVTASASAAARVWPAPVIAALGLIVLAQGAWIIRHAMLTVPSESDFRAMAQRVLTESEERMKQAGKRQEQQITAYLEQAEKASAEQLRRFDELSKRPIGELEKGVAEAKRLADTAAAEVRKAAEQEIAKGQEQVRQLVATTTAAIDKAKNDLNATVADARKSLPDFSKPVEIVGPLTVASADGATTVISGGSISIASIARRGDKCETFLSSSGLLAENAATQSSIIVGFDLDNGLPRILSSVAGDSGFFLGTNQATKLSQLSIFGDDCTLATIGGTSTGGQILIWGPDKGSDAVVSIGAQRGNLSAVRVSSAKTKASVTIASTSNGTPCLFLTDNEGRIALSCGIEDEGLHAGEGFFHPVNPLTQRGQVIRP